MKNELTSNENLLASLVHTKKGYSHVHIRYVDDEHARQT